jgi:hypothetical protein
LPGLDIAFIKAINTKQDFEKKLQPISDRKFDVG